MRLSIKTKIGGILWGIYPYKLYVVKQWYVHLKKKGYELKGKLNEILQAFIQSYLQNNGFPDCYNHLAIT